MGKVGAICVYCGSSNNVPEIYKKSARDLGIILAQQNIKMVYGGGTTGLMGICATSCVESGGYVIGVTTEHLAKHEGGHKKISELYVVESMHQRKIKMFECAEAFICLPGGLGTLEEAFEIMTWKQIGLHTKHIVFVNINNYWEDLIKLLGKIEHNGFMRAEDHSLYTLANSIDEALDLAMLPKKKDMDFMAKWV